MIAKLFALAIVVVVFGILFTAVMSYPLMLLWNNALIFAIPGLAEINFTTMWGISIFAWITGQVAKGVSAEFTTKE